MPDINGLEFIRKVKEIDSNVKVFLMTSNFEICSDLASLLSLANNSSSKELMIDEFIPKPFSIEKLIVLINRYMKVNQIKDPL
jgi:two-component SAPR family response regulator